VSQRAHRNHKKEEPVLQFLSRVTLCAFLGLSLSLTLQAQELRPTPAAALQRLKEGNARFASDRPAMRDIGDKRRSRLANGQQPFAVVLSCADSRVVPELLFDQGLGDLFVVRVAGNVAEKGMLGSIEYAVEHLHVPLVVVLGHESCGAVQAAVDGKALPGDLGWLVKQVYTGDKQTAAKQQTLAVAIRANARHQAAALTKESAELKELAAHKRVQVVAGIYSLATGKVTWLDLPEAKGP
jgi:carbonic anhydrase